MIGLSHIATSFGAALCGAATGTHSPDYHRATCELCLRAEVVLREQAVQNVDQREGYTIDFSPWPTSHALEYDEEQARLTDAAVLPFRGGVRWPAWRHPRTRPIQKQKEYHA